MRRRGIWRASKSRALPVLLDGVALASDPTSVTYFARWNEKGLDHDKDVCFMDTFDLSSWWLFHFRSFEVGRT